MQLRHKKYLTFAFVLLATLLAGIFGIDYIKDVYAETLYARQIARIKNAAGVAAIDDFHKKVDTLRVFINKNSQHKEDDEFFAVWRDKTKLAANFIDHLEGRRKTLPHMECSTRAAMMAAILQSEGYRTRSIDVYHPDETGELKGHALLDVFNPHTKRWETQDPEYDVYWKNSKTGERISMAEAAADLKTMIPCNARHCGWSVRSREGADGAALKALTAYVTPIDREARERMTFYRADINPHAVMIYNGKTGTYCEVLKKNCEDGFVRATPENLRAVRD